jgi:nitrogen regulatory protein A
MMENLKVEIEVSLSELRRLTSTDFAALAWSNQGDYIIRWKYASGNRNERYKRIILRPEKGIAGKVIRSGRPMILDSFTPKSGDDPREYPILLAEGLKSVVGMPVFINQRVMGVLLAGCRYTRSFEDDVIELVASVAEQLGSMIQQRGDEGDSILFYRLHL